MRKNKNLLLRLLNVLIVGQKIMTNLNRFNDVDLKSEI